MAPASPPTEAYHIHCWSVDSANTEGPQQQALAVAGLLDARVSNLTREDEGLGPRDKDKDIGVMCDDACTNSA